MTATDEILQMFQDVLNGKVDVWDFSFDFGEWLAGPRGDLLIDENEELFDYLNDEPVFAMELLPDYTLATNRELFTKFYEEAQKLAN